MNPGVVIFIVGILVVVMIHESGHFLVAKLFGFKATKFFVGFGPTLWSTTRGETEYGVKALPLGGFVKIVGMNPYEEIAPEDRDRAYTSKPRWQRALLLAAGSATHWVVAFVLLVVTTMTIGFPTDEATNQIAVVERSIEGIELPAFEAGIQPDDRIVGISGRETESWAQIRTFIRSNAGRVVEFTVERDGTQHDVRVELGRAIFDEEQRLVEYAPAGEELRSPRGAEEVAGFLGVQPQPFFKTESLPSALVSSAAKTWDITVLSVRGIGEVFSMVFGGDLWDALTGDGARELGEGPLGIVGAGQLASDSFARGRFLDLIGLILGFTVFVGVMNLLPLPPLDGGHLAVVAYEAITKKEVDVRKLIPVAAAVISFFVLLFLAVLYLDLARPIRVPF